MEILLTFQRKNLNIVRFKKSIFKILISSTSKEKKFFRGLTKNII